MTLVLVVLALALFVGLASVVHYRHGGYAPEPFAARACQGHVWRRAYPDSTKEELRQFLKLFTHAFAFRDSENLQFGPHDRVYGVYRTLYPRLGGMDVLEIETLAASVERTYGVKLEHIWSESLTLGNLFAACAAHTSRVA